MRKIKTSILFVIIMLGVMLYLFTTDSLSGNTVFIIVLIIIVALMFSSGEKRKVTKREAEKLAVLEIKHLIDIGAITSGELTVMPETILNYAVIRGNKSSKLIPDYWSISIIVGETGAYLVKISVDTGEIVGHGKIRLPSEYSALKEEMYKEVGQEREDIEKMKGDKTSQIG